jgi:hypothetical protein
MMGILLIFFLEFIIISEMVGIIEVLTHNCVILKVLFCSYAINVEDFCEYALETANLPVKDCL